MPGSDTGGGTSGPTKKFVATLTLSVAMAYSAFDGVKVPPSSVELAAIVRLDAPRMDTYS
eukprot:4707133-Prymnesium_polylepis.2